MFKNVIKAVVIKVVKVIQVLIGMDEKIVAARIKQAEMKAQAKFEIAAGRNVFEQVDTELVVPQKVINTIKSMLNERFIDKAVISSVFDLIERDFDRLFTPELCFDLIADPFTLDAIIQSYVERYIKKQISLCSTSDLQAYFKKMNYLQSLLESGPSGKNQSGRKEESVVKAAEKIVANVPKVARIPKVVKAVRPMIITEERQKAVQALEAAVRLPEVQKLKDDSIRAIDRVARSINSGLNSQYVARMIQLITSGESKLSF